MSLHSFLLITNFAPTLARTILALLQNPLGPVAGEAGSRLAQSIADATPPCHASRPFCVTCPLIFRSSAQNRGKIRYSAPTSVVRGPVVAQQLTSCLASSLDCKVYSSTVISNLYCRAVYQNPSSELPERSRTEPGQSNAVRQFFRQAAQLVARAPKILTSIL